MATAEKNNSKRQRDGILSDNANRVAETTDNDVIISLHAIEKGAQDCLYRSVVMGENERQRIAKRDAEWNAEVSREAKRLATEEVVFLRKQNSIIMDTLKETIKNAVEAETNLLNQTVENYRSQVESWRMQNGAMLDTMEEKIALEVAHKVASERANLTSICLDNEEKDAIRAQEAESHLRRLTNEFEAKKKQVEREEADKFEAKKDEFNELLHLKLMKAQRLADSQRREAEQRHEEELSVLYEKIMTYEMQIKSLKNELDMSYQRTKSKMEDFKTELIQSILTKN